MSEQTNANLVFNENPHDDKDCLNEDNNKKETIGLTKYRYVIVVIYCLVNFTISIHWISFASCAHNFGQLYGLNKFQVDAFSMIFMIAYPITCIPEAYIVDNVSAQLGLTLSAVCCIIGSGLKCLINKGIYFAYIGQGIIALFQAAISNSPGKIAATWFDEGSRVLVTTICVVSDTIGVLVGYLIHGFVFDDQLEEGEPVEKPLNKDRFFMYMLIEFFIALVLCLPMIILMRDKPKHPPSRSQRRYISPPLKQSIGMLCHNRNFIILFISTISLVGFLNTFGTICNSYLKLYFLTDTQISYLASSANLFGIISSGIVSVIIDKNKKYKTTLIILSCLGVIGMSSITCIFELVDKKYTLYICFILYILTISFITPIYTISMDYVIELTYPVGESISEGIIMTGNQLFGVVGTLICDLFMEYVKEIKYLPHLFFIFLIFVSVICSILIREKLNRHEKDIAPSEIDAKEEEEHEKEQKVEESKNEPVIKEDKLIEEVKNENKEGDQKVE